MDNVIVIAVVAAIVSLALWYVIRSKKKGNKCIGCPVGCKDCKQCSKNGM